MKYNSSLARRIDSNYKKMWIWSIVDVVAVVLAAVFFYLALGIYVVVESGNVSGINPNSNLSMAIIAAIFIFLTLVFFIITLVYAVKFVYNAWKTVARPDDKVTPGWRVFLMFVPVFNVIWAFFFFWEFAKRANEQLAILNRKQEVSSFAALLYCILNLLSSFAGGLNGMDKKALMASLAEFPLVLFSAILVLGVLNIVSLCLLILWVIQAHSASIEIAETRHNMRAVEIAEGYTA